ncbi:hypothetical protein RJE46_10615 [Cedecea neteri]|uniref:hypothetical protein n=1 Tax=Cedecea neteri TaxID=158822 RepID=UPI0028933B46|nr:hypothetical protein [Cedecea neteri]WNJ81649.1 hypothetical protein RJE46_10615 [Cedecea neteri]
MDKKEIRRLRLKEWFADKAIPEREKSYISQLINGKASFGERAARRLEREYGMLSNYLDSDPDGENPTQRVLNSQEERLIQLFSRLPESEKKHHLKALEEKVSEYERLFDEMLKIRNINKIDKAP